MSKQIVIPKFFDFGFDLTSDEEGWVFFLIPTINITKDISKEIENQTYIIPKTVTYGFHLTWLLFNFYIELNFEQ